MILQLLHIFKEEVCSRVPWDKSDIYWLLMNIYLQLMNFSSCYQMQLKLETIEKLMDGDKLSFSKSKISVWKSTINQSVSTRDL